MNLFKNCTVMTHIVGGGFWYGYSMIPMPQPLLDKNLVLVSMNYRVAIFGYATTLDEILPGNYGQLDQILALKWIQENIAYFGGDPKSVTVFGFSSGSMSVMAHVVSPLSNGLIHKAIMGSGCILCKHINCRTGEKFTRKVAQTINKSATSSQSIKDALQNVSANDSVLWDGITPSSFVISTDNTSGYMPLIPDEMPNQPNVAKIPVMIGTLPNDGGMQSLSARLQSSNRSNFLTSLRWLLQEIIMFPSSNLEEKIKIMMAEYGINHTENMTKKDISKHLMELSTDIIYASCCDTSIELLSKAGFPVYTYKFIHASNLTINFNGILLDHSVDNEFVVSLGPGEMYSSMTGGDLKTSQNMVDFWANFAKYGNPNPVHSKPGEDEVWKQWTVNSPGHILLDEIPSMESGYLSKHTPFWKNMSMC